MQNLQPFIDSLQSFAQKRLGFEHPPKLFLKQDAENAKDVFGKTAYYDPNEKSITIFTTGRHPKDILRSIAHELVHHCQNLRGDLSPEKCGEMGIGYAQQNDHMREMEREAYEKGNLCFRDWEDGIKVAMQQENNQLKENKKMVKISKKELKGLIGKLLEAKLQEQEQKKVLPPDAQKFLDTAKKVTADVRKATTAKGKKASEEAKSFIDTAKKAAAEVMKTAKAPVREETEELEEAGCGSNASKRDEDMNEGMCPKCNAMPCKCPMSEGEELEEAKKCPHCDGDAPKSECICGELKEEAKPDYLDLDGDGDKEEPMKKAAQDKKLKKEAIQTPEQEKALYESRYNVRNEAIFDTLKKLWTK